MAISDFVREDVQEVKDGEFPFYVLEQVVQEERERRVELQRIPQGPGSNLDSDTVDGFQAVSSAKYGPNKLVATGTDSKLPASIIPVLSGSPTISNRAGTLFYTLYVEDDGALSYDPVS